MADRITYVKNGKKHYFKEKSPYVLRCVLDEALREIGKKPTSNLLHVLRHFWLDKDMHLNFKGDDTRAGEIGCLKERTVRDQIPILKKAGLLLAAETPGRKGLKLNEKKILSILKILKKKKNYIITHFTDSAGKKRLCLESLYTLEKNILEKKLLAAGIKFRPAHLDLYQFLVYCNVTCITLSYREIQNRMYTLSHNTIKTTLDDLQKIGVVSRKNTGKKLDFFFKRISLPELSKKPGDDENRDQNQCNNFADNCNNSAKPGVKILPDKKIPVLIFQEEHLARLKTVSSKLKKSKNISQCWNYLSGKGISKTQLTRHLYPAAKKQRDPAVYLNYMINQFEYIQQQHPYKILNNNTAKFLYNSIYNGWDDKQYLHYLNGLAEYYTPETKRTASKPKPGKKPDTTNISHTPGSWIEELEKKAKQDPKGHKTENRMAENIKRFLNMSQ